MKTLLSEKYHAPPSFAMNPLSHKSLVLHFLTSSTLNPSPLVPLFHMIGKKKSTLTKVVLRRLRARLAKPINQPFCYPLAPVFMVSPKKKLQLQITKCEQSKSKSGEPQPQPQLN